MHVDPPNSLSLNTLVDSKITNINLYTNRAQITRAYNFKAVAGQNELTILQLPNVLHRNSLRVEGKGQIIIQSVTSHKDDMEKPQDTSPLLDELRDKKRHAENALERCKKAIGTVDAYMNKLDVQHLDISKLGQAMDVYDASEEKLHNKIIEVEKKIAVITEQIKEETEKLEETVGNNKLRTRVVIELFSESDLDVELLLIYAVSHARWNATYDIRVKMQDLDQGSAVRLIYKADISQQTGEIWEKAPITLETAQPTFGVDIPILQQWKINLHDPKKTGFGRGRGGAMRHRKILRSSDDMEYEEDDEEGFSVTSRGHVSATFRVSGLSTIPSDDFDHSVTIAELDLEASLSWVCVPKRDSRVHLEATIKNSSAYTFLSGDSNVFVDQSFISRSTVGNVSPKETFTCALGIDPSIRVTYYPVEKVVSEKGFYNKAQNYSYTQRILVQNTKRVDISGLKITDSIPVSEDANLAVNLIHPRLPLPSAAASKEFPKCQVTEGVIAQWNGSRDSNREIASLGSDGQLDWVCAIPAFGTKNLSLKWEVVNWTKLGVVGI